MAPAPVVTGALGNSRPGREATAAQTLGLHWVQRGAWYVPQGQGARGLSCPAWSSGPYLFFPDLKHFKVVIVICIFFPLRSSFLIAGLVISLLFMYLYLRVCYMCMWMYMHVC